MIWLVIILIILIIIIIKHYIIRYDTVIAFTGGLGSGKSLLSTKYAIRLLRKNSAKVWRHNYLWRWLPWNYKKFVKWQRPELYSSIPLRFRRTLFSKKEFSLELTDDHILLRSRLKNRSVVFIDEIGSYCNQYEYRNPNATGSFDEFVRLFRHYTKGGFLVVNDQCSENIVLTVRRRINTVFNLMHFRKWFGIIYTVKVRNISVSEEIKTIEEQNAEDNMRTHFGLLLGMKKVYDTFCYSERYNSVPKNEDKPYNHLKKMRLMTIPKIKIEPLTSSEESMLGPYKPIKAKKPGNTKCRAVKLGKKGNRIS